MSSTPMSTDQSRRDGLQGSQICRKMRAGDNFASMNSNPRALALTGHSRVAFLTHSRCAGWLSLPQSLSRVGLLSLARITVQVARK